MKPIVRVTLLGLLILLASTAAFADTLTIGSLDLYNVIAGPGGQDEFDLTNITGIGAPSSSTTTPLTFSGMQLSINGGASVPVSSLSAGGFETLASSLLQGSITAFTLQGSLSPTTVFFNGVSEQLNPASFLVSYSGPALDTSGSCATDGTGCPHFDVTATATPVVSTPEPAVLSLFGFSCVTLLLRRRGAKA